MKQRFPRIFHFIHINSNIPSIRSWNIVGISASPRNFQETVESSEVSSRDGEHI